MSFEDKIVCITGKLQNYTRNELKGILEDNGATVNSSVSKKLDYVICGADAGSKLTKAKKYGIEILDEDDIEDMLTPKKKPKKKAAKKKTTKKKATKKKRSIKQSKSTDLESDDDMTPPKKKVKKNTKKKTTKKKKIESSSDEESKVSSDGDDDGDVEMDDGTVSTSLPSDPGIKAPNVKACKWGDWSNSNFPENEWDYKLVRMVILMCSVTTGGRNNNKYYVLEEHISNDNKHFRLFTHYGRLDDLSSNPEAGKRECRYYDTKDEMDAAFIKIYKQKTAASKGYKPVNVSYSQVGSPKARGYMNSSSTNNNKNNKKSTKKSKSKNNKSKLSDGIGELIEYIFNEAKNRITKQISCTITEKGFMTPLGALTLDQIQKGENILLELFDLFKKKKKSSSDKTKMDNLNNLFYSTIPHKLGRSKSAVQANKLDNWEAFEEKQETIQIMKDMLNANEDENVLGNNAELFDQYKSLNTKINKLSKTSKEYKNLIKKVIPDSISRSHGGEMIDIVNIFKIEREIEKKRLKTIKKIGNTKLLYHGSRCCNWVGILSRGLLLPKIVVKLGVNRTDGGWLGDGIYFGEADTGSGYAQAGSKNTAFFLIANVALGKMHEYDTITYGLQIPKSYNSAYGNPNLDGSDFYDNEYVIYKEEQHMLSYLVEFKKQSYW